MDKYGLIGYPLQHSFSISYFNEKFQNEYINAKYINFAIDFLPDEYQHKEITDFRLNFCREIKKGEVMHVYGFFDDENRKIVVAGKRDVPEFDKDIKKYNIAFI